MQDILFRCSDDDLHKDVLVGNGCAGFFFKRVKDRVEKLLNLYRFLMVEKDLEKFGT